MSILNNKTTKVVEFNTCPNVTLNRSLLSLLEEEGGVVIICKTSGCLQFKYLKYSKFRFAKRGYVNAKLSLLQKKKASSLYKKPLYFLKSSKISSNKVLKLKLPFECLFASRI